MLTTVTLSESASHKEKLLRYHQLEVLEGAGGAGRNPAERAAGALPTPRT